MPLNVDSIKEKKYFFQFDTEKRLRWWYSLWTMLVVNYLILWFAFEMLHKKYHRGIYSNGISSPLRWISFEIRFIFLLAFEGIIECEYRQVKVTSHRHMVLWQKKMCFRDNSKQADDVSRMMEPFCLLNLFSNVEIKRRETRVHVCPWCAM